MLFITMKKIILLPIFSLLFLMGVGCQQKALEQTNEEIDLLSSEAEQQIQPSVETGQKEDKIDEAVKEPLPKEQGVTLYKGSWFDVYYPSNFIAKPTKPISISTDIKIPGVAPRSEVITDEAYFVSNDGSVEFFVFSPLWAGDPKNYLIVAPNEELVNETIDEKREIDYPNQYGDEITRWVTIKAKDDSYYRSYISIYELVGTGSDVHHVFGIKYKDIESYEKYKESYINFKTSLRQYSD